MDSREMEMLFKPVETSEEEKELRTWIRKNAETLRQWNDPRQSAAFALMNGFDRDLVIKVFSCYQDALNGTHIEKRAQFQSWLLDKAINDVIRLRNEMAKPKPFDLKPSWKNVHAYQSGESL